MEPIAFSSSPEHQPIQLNSLINDDDIIFNCPHCGGELVVDKEGAGMMFDCSHCAKEIMVPPYSGPPERRRIQGPQKAALASEAAPLDQDLQSAPVKATDLTGQDSEMLQERLAQLKLQYKENSSQRTEMRGHINRTQIDLHRLQLKLQKLVDRQMQMEADITAIQGELSKEAPTS